jgi:hypothetical protein
MKVTKFEKPDTSVKSVYVYYFGKYPKKTKPAKDVTLPIRLWPEATFYIRCNTKGGIGKNNLEYFSNLYAGTRFELVEETLDQIVDADMLFIHHENYNAFGGVVRECCIDFAQILGKWKKKATVFYNDELFSGFYDIRDWLESRSTNENFLKKNPQILERVPRSENWENVTLLMNENKITDWANEHVKDTLTDRITVSYLSDIILYDLPTSGMKYKSNYEKRGVYIPLFTAERISVCNKLFNGNVDITFAGSRSDELKENIAGDGKYIQNFELPVVLKKYDWTIYIGKGKQSSYLGATFYEPLLKGLPVFVWTETDKQKKVFGDIDCYFSNEDQLKTLVEKWDMKELYKTQVLHVFGNEPEEGESEEPVVKIESLKKEPNVTALF